jgi:signal transduction histidine kinase
MLEPGTYVINGVCHECEETQQLLTLSVSEGKHTEAPTPDLKVDMTDFRFESLPSEIAAGEQLWEIANTGEQGHFVAFLKLTEGKTLEASLEPAKVLPQTVTTIAQVLKLPFVEIALCQEGNLQTVSSVGKAKPFSETFPLIYAGERIGELRVAPREGESKLSQADHHLLNDLSRQVGVAAHALLLQADLERSRLRVVSAREETRRRLGNDLHDSVGHQLAGLMRRAETASNLLERDPTAARKLLGELVQGSQGAIEHVRALAHQLHPPELEVLGLADAIREKVQTFGPSSELRISLETDT